MSNDRFVIDVCSNCYGHSRWTDEGPTCMRCCASGREYRLVKEEPDAEELAKLLNDAYRQGWEDALQITMGHRQ